MVARVMFALLFVAWIGEWPREIDAFLYSGLWRSPFEIFAPLFAPVPGIRMFPWQLLLIAMVPVCLAMPGGPRHRAREMDAAIVISLGCVAITFLWGWARGGAPYYAYYQLWRFLTALLVGYLLMSAIRTPRDLRALAMTIVAAALIRGTLVIYFYWVHVHGKINPAPDYMTNHDDSLLFVAAIVIAGSWAVVKGGRAASIAGMLVSLYLAYSVVLNDRRIAWVELVMAMVAIYVLIGAGPLRRRVNRWLVVLAPLVLAYIAVGWGREGAVFAPIQALASTGSDYDPSSVARQEEVRNLLYTLSVGGNPLLGTGWGNPYQKVTSIYANFSDEWVLALYTPHNSLLGLAAFSGLVGVLGIWGVVPLAAYLAARGYRRFRDPIGHTAAMAVVGILAAYGVHCYGDLGLQSFACGLIFGVALATAGKIGAWSNAPAFTRTAKVPAQHSRAIPTTLRPSTASAIRVHDRPAHRGAPTGALDSVPAGQASTRHPVP